MVLRLAIGFVVLLGLGLVIVLRDVPLYKECRAMGNPMGQCLIWPEG